MSENATDQQTGNVQQQFQVADAQGFVWFLGIGAIVGGILSLQGLLPQLSPWPSLVGGAVFCGLAYGVRKQSRDALFGSLVLLGGVILRNIIIVVDTFDRGGVPLNLGAVGVGLSLFFSLLRVYLRTSSQTRKD